jgi:hypothetical protein
VRFTLTYEGQLPPSGDATQKMAIRSQLHPQLVELWNLEPLNGLHNLVEPGGKHLSDCNQFTFASLVHDYFTLRAELEILMLHAGPPGRIIANADIDNRLKTLFDALSCPINPQQIPGGWTPTPTEQPLYCLLQDDKRITRVAVETDRWLAAPDPLHVRLFVRVRVWTPRPSWGSVQILG